MRDIILLFLISVLFGNSILEAKVGASATGGSLPQETTKKATVQERILEIPPGTMIEVGLMNKNKVRGRLGRSQTRALASRKRKGTRLRRRRLPLPK